MISQTKRLAVAVAGVLAAAAGGGGERRAGVRPTLHCRPSILHPQRLQQGELSVNHQY